MHRLAHAIHQLRLSREWTQEQLALAAGPSVETISNIERGTVRPQGLTMQKLLRALQADPQKFHAYVAGDLDDLRAVEPPPSPDPAPRRRAAAGSAADPPTPPGLHLHLRRPARAVPEFPIGIAASQRVEKLAADHSDTFRMVDTEDIRVFTAPVDGDCMSPVWNDRETVIFSYDAFDREGILPGRSYYLAFTDGTSTFKRLFPDAEDADVYRLTCWNAAKYPQIRRVHYSEVVRIARAVSKVIVPEETAE
ncbi:MAG TPA: XRE family transcriptional regulator [Tepidisphaeraceae bacterium]|jgi:transcriptional regulator with XRE-family HTH domain|nr:XRE family transcriptional regulator [Tepidisphaeraceae bacterium]